MHRSADYTSYNAQGLEWGASDYHVRRTGFHTTQALDPKNCLELF